MALPHGQTPSSRARANVHSTNPRELHLSGPRRMHIIPASYHGDCGREDVVIERVTIGPRDIGTGIGRAQVRSHVLP